MIDFDLTEEQQTLREVARGMLRKECLMTLVRRTMMSEEGFSRELWSKIAQAGWLGLIISNEFSGAGMNSVELAIILDEMERVAFQGPYIESAVLGPTLIMLTGTREQKNRFLPKISNGELVISCALKEESFDQLQSPSSPIAVSSGDRYLVSGTIPLVGFAKQSDYIIVPFRVKESLLFALADSKSQGIKFSEDTALDPTVRLSNVAFDAVAVPREDVFQAQDPRGLLDHLVALGGVCVSAASVGGASRVLEMSLEYSKSRIQFGVPIGSFQAVKHKFADMFSLISGGESAAYYSAWCYSQNTMDARIQASVAKLYCTKMYSNVSGQGIQIHGGIGFTWDHDLHIFLKRAKRYEFSFGSPSWHAESIARHIVDGMPLESFISESEKITPNLVAGAPPK